MISQARNERASNVVARGKKPEKIALCKRDRE
jgi:hypothetical protein